MVNKIKTIAAVLFVFSYTMQVFAQSGPKQSLTQKEFVQTIEWKKDAFAEEYEIEIQDESFKPILTKRTKNTKIKLSLKHGIYRYRIFSFDLFGNRSGGEEWLTLEIYKAVKPIIYGDEVKRIFYESGTELELTLDVSGFSEMTRLTLLSDNRDRNYEAKIISYVENKFIGGNHQNAKIKITATELSEGKYFFHAENPGGQKYEGGRFEIRFINRPVIVNFNPDVIYSIKGARTELTLTAQNVDSTCKYFLVSEDNKRIQCQVKSTEKRDIDFLISLYVNTNSAGLYKIRVENAAGFSDEAEGFSVLRTMQPHITDVADGYFKVNSSKNFSVKFSATGLMDDTVIKLVEVDNPSKFVAAKNSQWNEDGSLTAAFSGMNLKSKRYKLVLENPGKLTDEAGEFELSVMQGVDLTIGLGVYSGTIILLYNDSLPDYTHSTFTLGALVNIAVVPIKEAFGYVGFGITAMGSYWERPHNNSKNQMYSGLGTLEVLYQKPFFDERLRVQVCLGGGYSVFGHSVLDGSEREFAQCAVIKTGAAVVWYPLRHLYFELGADYYHLFASENYSGLVIPHFTLGARF
ncbi:hypothetical protein [Treponema sp.]|uniref:hypothetical protein n=1 Tax=Treponema sp. TaxID=166 RepID=UPI00298E32DE|nr:hypothetical protein [Treponema sp.]MCR5613353.1 hypothetical protein [Treponema sp.]